MSDTHHPILLYDGVCGLCARLIQFLLPRDTTGVFRFAAIQSEVGASYIRRHGHNPQKLETVFIVLNPNSPKEKLISKSTAVSYVLLRLPKLWPLLGVLSWLVPVPIRNWAYQSVARSRYRWFGQSDHCLLPNPQWQSRFLDTTKLIRPSK